MPQARQNKADEIIEQAFNGTQTAELEDAREIAEECLQELGLKIRQELLVGATKEQARQVLWNAFDDRYRPEMRTMERGLLLAQLDSAWKNHLYTMDHLRSTVGLRGYAQEDPKTVYKREGMKEFESMWEGVEERVTEIVFRMEEAEEVQDTVWVIGSAIHESAPRLEAPAEQQVSTNQSGQEVKVETIRNRGERVGRNDPCPCGSGKKYKNCCMKSSAV